MKELQYVRAAGIKEAVSLLNEAGLKCRPLAGSTDLALLLRQNPGLCDRLVDISLIPEMHRITEAGDTVTIGAAATFSEVMSNPIVQLTAGLLADACHRVGAVQVRNMGTIGGNVANAAACADSLPALVCLDTLAQVRTPSGELTWPVSELIDRPNHTLIPAGGLLVSLSYKIPPAGSRGSFQKLGRRNAMAISRLTVALLGRLDALGCVAEIRIVTGSATPQIARIRPAEAVMIGQKPDRELYAATARAVAEEMVRLSGRRWSTEFKEPVLMSMVERGLATIFEPLLEKAGAA